MKDLINYTISINTTASSWKITDKYKAWAIANDRKDLLEIMLDCTKKFNINGSVQKSECLQKE